MNNKALLWVPTLYFTEGIPYFIVNVISVTMFKRLGMPNGELAFWTSLLYLPWVIKPLWSPLIDTLRTKRWWITATQALCTVLFALLSLSVSPGIYGWSLVIFYLMAFTSATHDIAADGFYMLALDSHSQSIFVGIRSLFYRIASVFGQGVIVVVAGYLENRTGDIPAAWKITIAASGVILLLMTVWHCLVLPRPTCDTGAGASEGKALDSFKTFFSKPGIWTAMAFLLLFRLPEALSLKLLTPFMLDPLDKGGLALSTTQSGMVYGTAGVIALTIGGIVGGFAGAKWGLRKMMWPMALSLALPCSVYLYLAIAQPTKIWIVYLCVVFDQFGYGFGFTAYMLYMLYFSKGRYATSHYAICTAFMALSMMLPGLFAGWLQEQLGYDGFFRVVMFCCLLTIAAVCLAARTVDKNYGKKDK